MFGEMGNRSHIQLEGSVWGRSHDKLEGSMKEGIDHMIDYMIN